MEVHCEVKRDTSIRLAAVYCCHLLLVLLTTRNSRSKIHEGRQGMLYLIKAINNFTFHLIISLGPLRQM
jgi:hypothetical protein